MLIRWLDRLLERDTRAFIGVLDSMNALNGAPSTGWAQVADLAKSDPAPRERVPVDR